MNYLDSSLLSALDFGIRIPIRVQIQKIPLEGGIEFCE